MSAATIHEPGKDVGEVPLAPRGGLWREEVLDRVGRLAAELDLLKRGDDPAIRRAREHLANARALTVHTLSPAEWWSGSRVEACWRELRLAEEGLLEIGSEAEVMAKVRDARAHASFYLGDQDQRTKDLVSLIDGPNPPSPPRVVPTARIALTASHEASDRQHRERRSFMNTLRVTIGLLVVLAALLVVAVARWGWDFMPGVGDRSQVALVAVAMLFGALGAMFSAVPSLAQMPSSAQTFNPVRTQAMLKVVVGAWSAVVGLMAVSAGFATDAVTTAGGAAGHTQTLAGFAMVAALFGAAQEAITRFADHKAAGLSGSDAATGPTTP